MIKGSKLDECCSCSEEVPEPHPIFELCRLKRFDEAEDICRREIAADPNNAAGYRHMAAVMSLSDRKFEALSYKDKVVALSPDVSVSYYSRADLLYDLGDYAAAIRDFTRAAELDYDRCLGSVTYLYRADCHRRLGDYEQALADCALVPDGYDFPGFLGHWEGSKEHLLAEIERELQSAGDSTDQRKK